jgi:polyisoprenoid-binding protein YceI
VLPGLAAAEPRPWTLQKGTGRARFRVEAPLDAIEGSSSGLTGELRFDEATWAEAAGKIHISLSGFTTGLTLRDEDLRDQFFQTDRFPEAILTSPASSDPSQGALVPGREAQADAVGTLALHGKEHPVRIPNLGASSPTRPATGTSRSPVASMSPSPSTASLAPPGSSSSSAPSPASASRPPSAATHPGTAPVALAAPPPAPTAATGRPPRVELLGQRRPPPREAQGPSPAPRAGSSPSPRPRAAASGSSATASAGGEQNALACSSCHAWRDERSGSLDPQGHASTNSSLWNSARRATFWRGFASTPEDATDLCIRRFMLRPGGGDPTQLAELGAYLRRISPDASPPLDYRPMLLGRKTGIDRPTGGDGKRGALLTERFCGRCHGDGAMRPPLEVGLYEPDYLVTRSGGSPPTTRSRCRPSPWIASPTPSCATSSPTSSAAPTTASSSAGGRPHPGPRRPVLQQTGPLAAVSPKN